MSSKLKRKLIVFNEEDAHQRELLEWVGSRSSNFSGFVKNVLFAYMTGGNISQVTVEAPPVTAKFAGIGDIL